MCNRVKLFWSSTENKYPGGIHCNSLGVQNHKLKKEDAERIEAETGRSIDEMSDEELRQEMERRGIVPEPMSENDKTYANEMGGSGEEEPDYLEQLEKLGKLRDDGIITEGEFEAKKAQLLGL